MTLLCFGRVEDDEEFEMVDDFNSQLASAPSTSLYNITIILLTADC